MDLILIPEAPHMDIVFSLIQFDQLPCEISHMNPRTAVNMRRKFFGQDGNFQ
jgi:hypothetical protein